jgi:hypothetical protein
MPKEKKKKLVIVDVPDWITFVSPKIAKILKWEKGLPVKIKVQPGKKAKDWIDKVERWRKEIMPETKSSYKENK